MKKYYFIIIFLFSISFLGTTYSAHSEIEVKLRELHSQQARLEKMKIAINSLFILAKKSDQQGVIEIVLRDVSSEIDDVQKRVQMRIEETEKQKRKEDMKTTDDWRKLTEVFLEEPTLDNFEYFCKRSKEVDGPETKEILSDDRTKIITVNKKFYESLDWCSEYFSEENYFFADNQNNKHIIEFHNSDTDEIRKFKIEYNKRIENSNFFGFHNRACSDCYSDRPYLWKCDYSQIGKDPVLHFNACVDTIRRLKIKHNSTGFLQQMGTSKDIISEIEKML